MKWVPKQNKDMLAKLFLNAEIEEEESKGPAIDEKATHEMALVAEDQVRLEHDLEWLAVLKATQGSIPLLRKKY